MNAFWLIRFYSDKFLIYGTSLMFFFFGFFLLFEEFKFFNLFYFLISPFLLHFFIQSYILNPNQKILWTDLGPAKYMYLFAKSFLMIRWIFIPLAIGTLLFIFQNQADVGTVLWFKFFYFYIVGCGTAYFGTSFLYQCGYREYKPYKNIINFNFLLKLLFTPYLFWGVTIFSFSLIQFSNVLGRPEGLRGGLFEFKKIDPKLKIQLTKELLKMNGRLINVKQEEELINTPEFTIISIIDFIRWSFSLGWTLSPTILHIHKTFNWRYLIIKAFQSAEEQRILNCRNNIPEMEQKVEHLIAQLKGPIEDVDEYKYEYIKIMVAIEYPNVIDENKVELNIDHITAKFKDLNLMS
jgi:hypothetical protein